MSRTRNFVFTKNNYDDEFECYINEVIEPLSRYITYGREVGAQGTPHLQGYIVFRDAKTIAAVRGLMQGCHIEIRRGSHKQAKEYAQKDGDIYEAGQEPIDQEQKGRRELERWDRARQSAISGDFDAIPSDIYIRCYSTIKKIARDHLAPVRNLHQPCGIWLWGAAGAGKSFSARQAYPEAYIKEANKWWDAYQDEEVVIFDDIDPSMGWCKRFLKIWGDRYPFLAEEKGGTKRIRPQLFIVTSQYSIEDCFSDQETRDALRRRYTVVKKYLNIPVELPNKIPFID